MVNAKGFGQGMEGAMEYLAGSVWPKSSQERHKYE